MSSPPLNEPGNRAGLFKRPVHSSASSRWLQALVQNRKQLRVRSFVLAAWPSCRDPRQPAANEPGGGPIRHVISLSSNAWLARLRQARPRQIVYRISLRALRSVPSGAGVRALLPQHNLPATHGAAVLLKTGAILPIGYSSTVSMKDLERSIGSRAHEPSLQAYIEKLALTDEPYDYWADIDE